MMRWLILLALLLQPAEPTLTATLTPNGVVTTWAAGETVCPWLESGVVKLYAGGALPCRAAGSALLSYVPDVPARLVLRTPGGVEVAGVDLGYRVILPVVVR